jgi:hypothetical protein
LKAALPLAELSSSARYRAILLLCCSGYGISEGSLAQLRGPHIHNVDEWLRRVAGLSRVAVSSCALLPTTTAIVQQLLTVPHDAFHTIQLTPVDKTQNWNMWCVAIALRFAQPVSVSDVPATSAIHHIVITGLANKVPYRCIQASCALAQWVCDGLNALPFSARLRPEYQQQLHALMASSKNVANWDRATACLQNALSASGQLAEQLSLRHASSATFVTGMLTLRSHALLKPPTDSQLWFQDEQGLIDNVMVVCCTAALMSTFVTAAPHNDSTCWLALQRWAQLCGACTLAAALSSCSPAAHVVPQVQRAAQLLLLWAQCGAATLAYALFLWRSTTGCRGARACCKPLTSCLPQPLPSGTATHGSCLRRFKLRSCWSRRQLQRSSAKAPTLRQCWRVLPSAASTSTLSTAWKTWSAQVQPFATATIGSRVSLPFTHNMLMVQKRSGCSLLFPPSSRSSWQQNKRACDAFLLCCLSVASPSLPPTCCLRLQAIYLFAAARSAARRS